ncbi:MAG: TolC family protein [Burkholderiaceae bacterium]
MTLHLRFRLVAAAALLAASHTALAALSLADTVRLAREQAPSLLAQQHALDGARSAERAAGTLPDPKLGVGVENYPVGGPDRYSLTRDFMTMQRIALMQDVPNRAKRAARESLAQARSERERAMLTVAQLAVQRDATLAWLAVHYAERRVAQLTELERENQLQQDTLDARIAAGRAMPAERTMARQEALTLADRRDDAQRDIAKARASLRRWVGARADEPLDGDAALPNVSPEQVRADIHRHAEIAPYAAMHEMAQAEAREVDAEQRGDWGWEVAYSKRGSQYGDMMSFQLTFELPWQRGERQQPQLAAKQKEAQRVEAERDETMRRHREELDMQLAELQALDRQHARLAGSALALAAERVELALASYRAGRGDLGSVLAARREAVDARLKLIELDAQRAALRVRLTTLVAE